MRIELMVGTTNVVRFPVERRAPPTMDLLRDITPDVREVLLLVESFGLSMPDYDPRHAADAVAADHIANHVRPEPGALRHAGLDAVLACFVLRATAACRAASRDLGGDRCKAAGRRCPNPWWILASANGGACPTSDGDSRASPRGGPCTERRGGRRQPCCRSRQAWSNLGPV